MDQARTLLTNVTLRGRLGLGASALGVLVVGLLLFRLASAPSYTLLTTGLDPAQAGKVTAALDQKGIRYELRNNGTALAVDKARTAQARVALAEQGLPGTTGPGFELFDKQKLGTSDFQQKVTYQRALEGEIARTIGQIQGVAGAQVRLALPTQDVFAETQRPPTAAVLLAGSADGPDAASVRGIARLVASSVEGLKPSNVTIAGGASNNYKRKSATPEFGVDKLVTHTQVAPGQVKKLSVALLVDKSVPPAQFAALKQAVAGAAGITPARGDQLTAQQVAFAKP